MPCCLGPRECHDFDDEREGVSDADAARFGGDDIECPECGASVYHDAALCPKCGYAIMAGEGRRASSRSQSSQWIVPWAAALVIVGIALCCMKWMF